METIIVKVVYDNPVHNEHDEYTATLPDVIESFDGQWHIEMTRAINKGDDVTIQNGSGTTTVSPISQNGFSFAFV